VPHPDSEHVCPPCGEPAVPASPPPSPWFDTWTNTGHPVPEWSHADGEPLCPVVGEHGYEPATAVPAPEHEAAADGDDGRRYVVAVPRGVDPVRDASHPHAEHHAITVHGSADLADRLAQANDAGVAVAFRRLDPADTDTDNDADADGF